MPKLVRSGSGTRRRKKRRKQRSTSHNNTHGKCEMEKNTRKNHQRKLTEEEKKRLGDALSFMGDFPTDMSSWQVLREEETCTGNSVLIIGRWDKEESGSVLQILSYSPITGRITKSYVGRYARDSEISVFSIVPNVTRVNTDGTFTAKIRIRHFLKTCIMKDGEMHCEELPQLDNADVTGQIPDYGYWMLNKPLYSTVGNEAEEDGYKIIGASTDGYWLLFQKIENDNLSLMIYNRSSHASITKTISLDEGVKEAKVLGVLPGKSYGELQVIVNAEKYRRTERHSTGNYTINVNVPLPGFEAIYHPNGANDSARVLKSNSQKQNSDKGGEEGTHSKHDSGSINRGHNSDDTRSNRRILSDERILMGDESSENSEIIPSRGHSPPKRNAPHDGKKQPQGTRLCVPD